MAPELVKASYSIRLKGITWLMAYVGSASLCVALAPDPMLPQENSAEEPTAEHAEELTAARDLLMEGKYERAAETYKAAALPGKSLEAGLGLARCRERLGAYDEAIAGLTRLDAPENADWHRLLAKLLRLKGRHDETISHSRDAIRINPSDAGARLILAETLELLGRREEGIEAYLWFDRQLVERAGLTKDAAWVTAVAVGFVRYSILTETNVTRRTQHALHEMLQKAYQRLDRSWWPARIAAADLLRAKFNNDKEDGSVADYRAALRINPNLPEAFVGLGKVLLGGFNFEKVEHLVESAQEINPNHPGAFHLLAEKYLRERRYAQASEVCERALAVNPRDLTALSLNAASYACRYDSAAVGRLRSRIDEINPRCATLHRILGDALAGIRQYADSEREYLAAIEADPTDANARTELGMMYMQWGREARAREVLQAAWALDAFNQRTKFTLDLLESLDSFAHFETTHFVIKYDAKQDPGLGPYLSDCLEKIYAEVTGDFNVSLEDRTIIELFPTKRAFGVRITGKPWIHTVGACTGRVIALTSPRQSPKLLGPYRIDQVLTHEFTHTVTLALTHNRIPHWFTEGLAVLQENAPRSFAWSELLADAVRRDRLFTLESITWGFIRPRRPNDRTLAYAQSEWMCEYLIERLGYEVIEDMLQQFRAGRTQEDVFRDQVAVEPAEFDGKFRHWAKQQVADWGFNTEPPEDIDELRSIVRGDEDSASLWGRLARAEYDEGMNERAQAAARRALELDENERNALNVLAKVLLEYALREEQETAKRSYEDEALPLLRRLEAIEPDSWTAARGLARIALRRGKRHLAIEPLERLQRVCPIDPLSWQGLAGIYLEREAYDRALPQLLELARTNATDKEIPRQIASIFRRKGRLRDARYWYQQAVYIDPFDVDLHETLAETGKQIGDWAGVLRECRMLISLQPSSALHYENAAAAAREMGDSKTAEAYARRAVQLDPSTEAQSPIKSHP